VRSWTLMVISTSLIGLATVTPIMARAETRTLVSSHVPRATTAAMHEVSPVAPVSPATLVSPAAQTAAVTSMAAVAPVPAVAPAPSASLDIDVRGLRRHVQSIAKLVGHPARELATKLGAAATSGDGTIEWNLADTGVDAANAYGVASVVDGKVTGFVIRGRASLDKLLKLHLHRPLQLTRAGGERPSYSITAGE
jgi:hypothetical protein